MKKDEGNGFESISNIVKIQKDLDFIDVVRFNESLEEETILNPDYLYDARYELLSNIPFSDLEQENQLQHMIGHSPFALENHSNLYSLFPVAHNKYMEIGSLLSDNESRNRKPTFRTGNFLYHDLAFTLYRGNPNFETNILYKSYADLYLSKMFSNVIIKEYYLPFRCFKKHDSDKEFYKYGVDCTLMEMLDIARWCDAYAQKHNQDQYIRNGEMGYFTQKLLRDPRLKNYHGKDWSKWIRDNYLELEGLSEDKRKGKFDRNITEYRKSGEAVPIFFAAYNYFMSQKEPLRALELADMTKF